MFSLILFDANDPQGLMRREAPNKQTNKQFYQARTYASAVNDTDEFTIVPWTFGLI